MFARVLLAVAVVVCSATIDVQSAPLARTANDDHSPIKSALDDSKLEVKALLEKSAARKKVQTTRRQQEESEDSSAEENDGMLKRIAMKRKNSGSGLRRRVAWNDDSSFDDDKRQIQKSVARRDDEQDEETDSEDESYDTDDKKRRSGVKKNVARLRRQDGDEDDYTEESDEDDEDSEDDDDDRLKKLSAIKRQADWLLGTSSDWGSSSSSSYGSPWDADSSPFGNPYGSSQAAEKRIFARKSRLGDRMSGAEFRMKRDHVDENGNNYNPHDDPHYSQYYGEDFPLPRRLAKKNKGLSAGKRQADWLLGNSDWGSSSSSSNAWDYKY
jgi:hypothetical protein